MNLRKMARTYGPNLHSTGDMAWVAGKPPFRAYWPMTVFQIFGGRYWSLAIIRLAEEPEEVPK